MKEVNLFKDLKGNLIEQVKVDIVSGYKTIDKKLFEKLEDALEHERSLKRVKVYEILRPTKDDDENYIISKHMSSVGYILVDSSEEHLLFVKHECFRKFGEEILFDQNYYMGEHIRLAYKIIPSYKNFWDLDKSEIIGVCIEQFMGNSPLEEYK